MPPTTRSSSFHILRLVHPSDAEASEGVPVPMTWEEVATVTAKSPMDAIKQYADSQDGNTDLPGRYVAVVERSWNVKEIRPRSGFDLV